MILPFPYKYDYKAYEIELQLRTLRITWIQITGPLDSSIIVQAPTFVSEISACLDTIRSLTRNAFHQTNLPILLGSNEISVISINIFL